MNIIVEGSVFDERATGVARFLNNILTVWTAQYKKYSYYVMKRSNILLPGMKDYSVNKVIIPWISKRNIMWQQLLVPRLVNDMQNAVYFAPNYTLPLGINIPAVLVIHDVSFFRYRQSGYFKNLFLKVLIRLSFRKADACIAVSQFIKDELIALFGSKEESKIHVAYNACETIFHSNPDREFKESVKQKYGISGQYIFNAGLMFTRRHPEVLLRAFHDLVKRKEEKLLLVMVGENRTVPYCDIEKISIELGVKEKVVWIPFVPEEELKALYSGCEVFVYLSDYEGFGLPVLEAIAAGKMAVCSGIKVFHELFEGACIFANDLQPTVVSDAISSALKEPLSKEQLKSCLSRYNWESSGTIIIRLMEEVHQNKYAGRK